MGTRSAIGEFSLLPLKDSTGTWLSDDGIRHQGSLPSWEISSLRPTVSKGTQFRFLPFFWASSCPTHLFLLSSPPRVSPLFLVIPLLSSPSSFPSPYSASLFSHSLLSPSSSSSIHPPLALPYFPVFFHRLFLPSLLFAFPSPFSPSIYFLLLFPFTLPYIFIFPLQFILIESFMRIMADLCAL